MPAGQPTKYNEKMVQAAKDYLQAIIDKDDIPYVEELAIKLGIARQTVYNWANEHDEFLGTIKAIEDFQRFMLQKGSVKGNYNPAASIFQLKANHGMIETEKRILAGDKDEPLEALIIVKNDSKS